MSNYFITIIFTLPTLYAFSKALNYENSCLNDEHCQQFEYDGIKANCTNKHCACFNSSDTEELIKCNVKDVKVIGDYCPCLQSNAFCKSTENVCYCDDDYMPSRDKLRCIKRAAALSESCELDEQCQQKDFNSICDPLNKTCVCLDNFLNVKNYCRSIMGDDFKCQNNADCFDNYGKSISYCSDLDKCYCIKNYIASTDGESCLLASQYHPFCFKDIQCTFNMGLGAQCLNHTCQCRENYVLFHRSNGDICTKKVERGQYCLTDSDCYQHQLNYSEQSLYCFYAECQCKSGFYSKNDGDCQRGSFARPIMPTVTLIALSYVVQMLWNTTIRNITLRYQSKNYYLINMLL